MRSQSDFVFRNPEEVFLIARVFQMKAEKYPKMKISFKRECEFLKALVCNFGKIDVEIDFILAQKFDFPPFYQVPTITEGFQEMKLGATNFLELGIMYKKSQTSPKFFILVIAIHRLSKKQLEISLSLV